MRSWWQQLMRSPQRRRNERTRVRDEIRDARDRDQADRQQAGVYDLRPPPPDMF